MPKYIKSHSNYRLSTKHQNVNGGKILERDITTIGGISPFANGQTVVHSSGNFIITINDSTGPSRHINKGGWVNNDMNGTIWNNEVLANQTSDTNGSVDSGIVLKNDFYDFRTFAYYGSLADLVQNSIGGILETFPYEIYTDDGKGEYDNYYLIATADRTEFTSSGTAAESKGDEVGTSIFIPKNDKFRAYKITTVSGGVETDWYEISNPGNINLHAVNVEECENENPLKYFANGGHENYGIILDEFNPNPDDGYSFEWKSELNCHNVSNDNPGSPDFLIPWRDDYFAVFFEKDTEFGPVNLGIGVINYVEGQSGNTVMAKAGQTLYFRKENEANYGVYDRYCPKPGDFVADITLTIKDCPLRDNNVIKLKAYRNDKLDVVYLVRPEDFRIHIRPKQSLSFYDDFKDSLNLFQKTLLGDFSGVKNTATFEVLNEDTLGTNKKLKTFVFPTNRGGWNPGGDGLDMIDYVKNLGRIGLYYDDVYSDNIYRSLTHEAIKNLDWTKGFNGADTADDENHYIRTGEKVKSILRIMGFFFDQEKAYIDCIGNTNTLTYNNRGNLSDYFITDKLTQDGWVVKSIATYGLKEYYSDGREVYEENMNDNNQKKNYYNRTFIEETNEIIQPYYSSEKASYWRYDESEGAFVETELTDDVNPCAIIRNYNSDKEYTVPEVNNEFMKRLAINSKYLLRKKGTIDGVEEMLGLLGFRSVRWLAELPAKVRSKYTNNLSDSFPFDYEINEYTAFAKPLQETWDIEHNMYRIDYLNSCKSVSYETPESMNGVYVPYQGLPVAYRDSNEKFLKANGQTTTNEEEAVKDNYGNPVRARYLYPYFDRQGIYDGELYFQMKGGWMNYSPYSFDSDSNLVPDDTLNTFSETMRDVRQTKNLQTLIDIPQAFLNEGTIIYVNDLSKNLALIDGHTYDLVPEKINGMTYYYFTVEVKDGGVWLGDNLYENFLAVSDPNAENDIVTYYIPALADGSVIKIYYDLQYEEKFYVKGFTSKKYYHTVWENDLLFTRECDSTEPDAYEVYEDELFPTSMLAFMNGSYNEDFGNYSNYFMLMDVNYYDLIGDDGWKQLSKQDPDYLRVNPIRDELEGNNPHCGNGNYDAGYAYMSAFKRLFGFALDNEYFNEANFRSLSEMYDELSAIGFEGITEENLNSYLGKLRADKKVHGMLDKIGEYDWCEDDETDKEFTHTISYYDNESNQKSEPYSAVCMPYTLEGSKSLYYSSGYKRAISSLSGHADSVTSQIMNTKIIEFIFYLGYRESVYKKDVQEKIKYIQDKIMPYVEQMLPSTAIPVVHFVSLPWLFDYSPDIPEGYYHNEYFLTPDGEWPYDESILEVGSNNLMLQDPGNPNDPLPKIASAERISRNGAWYIVYTFNPTESGNYTIEIDTNNTSTNGQSSGNNVTVSSLTIWDYEYKEVGFSAFTDDNNDKIISGTFPSLKRDTGYKVALKLKDTGELTPEEFVLDGYCNINKTS